MDFIFSIFFQNLMAICTNLRNSCNITEIMLQNLKEQIMRIGVMDK